MRAARLFVVVGFGGVLLGGCPEPTPPGDGGGGGGPPGCELTYLGDSVAEIEMELVFSGGDAADHPLTDGAVIDLVLPPQGGRVLFVGVRATNLDPCEAELSGVLRDLDTQQVRFDTRTVNLTPDGSGWGRSASGDLSSYANIPVCHNTWLEKDAYENDFELEVNLKDREGKTAQVKLMVRPTCSEPAVYDECRCICRGGYVLGEMCASGQGGAGGGG